MSERFKGRIAAVLIITVCLALSVVFSAYSFTGYVTAESVNNSANALALIFFLTGIAGSYFILKKR